MREDPLSSAPSSASSSRYAPLVGSDDTASESGCPSCGAAPRPRAAFCDACGLALRGKSKAAALFSSAEWAFQPGRYTLFGWIETALGVVGMAMGFFALIEFQNPGVRLSSLRVAEAVMVGLGLAAFVFLVAQRFFYRELFAFVYALLAMGGAICALMVVISHTTKPGSFLIVYFFAWMAAMFVKMFWICCADLGPTSHFKLDEHPLLDTKLKILVLTIFLAFINFVGFVVQLVILTTTYEEA